MSLTSKSNPSYVGICREHAGREAGRQGASAEGREVGGCVGEWQLPVSL